MSSELERFNQGLQDLIFIREKLNAELNGELARSNSLAKAVANLQQLNDAAQRTIEHALYSIGVWQEPVDEPITSDSQETIAPRFAPESASQTPPPLNGRQAMQRVMNGSHGVN
jgi:hypothetical protein